MTPDIERAARALMISEGDDPDRETTIADRPVGWMLMTDTVITVIEALAEPSDAAVEAAARAGLNYDLAVDSDEGDYDDLDPGVKNDLNSQMRAALRAANLAVLGRTE